MKKKQKTMLLWVGGLAALYFLTRSKQPAPAPPVRNTTTAGNLPQAMPSSPAAPASAMGLPYTYNAEI